MQKKWSILHQRNTPEGNSTILPTGLAKTQALVVWASPNKLAPDTALGPFKKYVTMKIPIFNPLLPCHSLSPFALIPSRPYHHPNSTKFFDPKWAEKSLGLCLTEHIRMPKSYTEWQEKSRTNKKTMFYVFKTSDTIVKK